LGNIRIFGQIFKNIKNKVTNSKSRNLFSQSPTTLGIPIEENNICLDNMNFLEPWMKSLAY